MQPLQCVSQHHVANLHVSTHMATRDDNNHAAIPLRSATTDSRHACKYAQEQPLVAEHRGGTHSRMKRPQPQPPHTRGTFHCRLKPLYTEKHKVSCAGFLPNTRPMQHSCSHYKVTTSQSRHFPKSHFPKSPHSLCHHLPSSSLPLVSHRPSSMSILV